ncbi:fatty acid synthase, partial [Nephila pilipes]
MPMKIENFKIHRATFISRSNPTKFFVNIFDSSGRFEITEGKSLVASGNIYEGKNLNLRNIPDFVKNDMFLSGEEVYNELKKSGYEYGPCFQSLIEINMEGTSGLVQWRNQWIPFLDSLFIFFGLVMNVEGLYLPTGLLSFKIDPSILKNTILASNTSNIEKQSNSTHSVPVTYDKYTRKCSSVGVEISNLNVNMVIHKGKSDSPILEKYQFVPYFTKCVLKGDSCPQLEKYCYASNDIINRIGIILRKNVNKFKLPFHNQLELNIEEYMNETNENRQILNVLSSLITNSHFKKDKVKEVFETYSRFVGKDMLNNVLVSENSLTFFMQIIQENTFRKLNVLEIIRNFPCVITSMADIQKKYLQSSFKKGSIITTKLSDVDQNILAERNIQVLPEGSLTDIAKEKTQDVAISSFMCGPLSELQDLLQTLTSVVISNGFILLFYKEKANPAELFLSTVCGEELQVHSEAVLQGVLQERNLIILSKISDPFGGSLYLLRSSSNSSHQTIIHVTEPNYVWVDKVKEELFEKKSDS